MQQKELISQVKSDCLSIVDREVQDRDAKLLEERISKAKLKHAVSRRVAVLSLDRVEPVTQHGTRAVG